MRNKVRKSLAFLLALALVVSVMSGLGLSVSADEGETPVPVAEEQEQPQEDKQETPAEEPAEEEEPAAEPAGEGSGEAQEGDTVSEQKEEPTLAASENVQTATVGSGDKTVTVTTTAAAGVLPEGAKLVVKQLEENGQAYQNAADELDASKIAYDGFLALDVGFQVNGQEVEPNGAVDVQFQLGAGLLPEELDADTLAVQHHDASEGVETVADAATVTEGTVAVQKETINAEFTVESFSTFTITWSGSLLTYFNVTVHPVDTNGTELTVTKNNLAISKDQTITFQNIAPTISGYTYQSAYYGSTAKSTVTSVKATANGNYTNTVRNLTFYNGSTSVATLTRGNWDDTKTADVYLVYQKDATGGGGTTGGEIVQEQELTRRKWVDYNQADDTYDLNLSVSGAKGTLTNKAKLNIILVLDISDSMNTDGTDGSRLAAIKNAAGTFVDTISAQKTVDAKYKVITFNGPSSMPSRNDSASNYSTNSCAQTKTTGWVAGSSAKTTVNGITAKGGTNYEAGIAKAKSELSSAESGAQTAVIFFSDGVPTFRSTYKSGGDSSLGSDGRSWYQDYGYGNGLGDPSGYNLDAAIAVAKTITCNYFYCVGTGSAVSDSLKNLADSVTADKKDAQTTSNVNNLTNIFKEIAGQITTFLCSNVTVTDVLSENVEMVLNASNQPEKLTVTVKDTEGNTVATLSGITASYDASKKQIVMNFPTDYQLNPEYTYIVTAKIKATKKAYEKYRENDGYTDMGEADTGTTSANKAGFYSNETDKAVVTYKYNGQDGSAKYPMPVIQLKPGTLTVTKTIAGDLTDTEKAALEGKMTIDVTLNGETEKVKLSRFSLNNNVYTLTLDKLSPDTMYSVTESNASVDGYNLTTTPATLPVIGKVGKGESKSVAITNTYTKATQDLTITKAVSGEDDACDLDVSDITYTFTITPATGVTVEDGTYGDATFSNNVGTVTITGTGTATVDDLPIGAYTVAETDRSGEPTGYDFDTASGTTKNVTLTTQTVGAVTITNNYKIKTFQVTVKKLVQGNASSGNDSFGFKVNDTTFSLKHNGTKDFTVKYNTSFTAEETDKNGYTLDSVEATGSTGTQSGDSYTIRNVTADTTITFTNDKTINPPSGVTRTIAPFVIMAVLAAGAGVYFVYSRRQRD